MEGGGGGDRETDRQTETRGGGRHPKSKRWGWVAGWGGDRELKLGNFNTQGL